MAEDNDRDQGHRIPVRVHDDDNPGAGAGSSKPRGSTFRSSNEAEARSLDDVDTAAAAIGSLASTDEEDRTWRRPLGDGLGAMPKDDDDPVVISIGDDDDDDPVVISIGDDDDDRVPRAQYRQMGREKIRLEAEVRKLQGDLYQLRASARAAEERAEEQQGQGQGLKRELEVAVDQAARSQAEFQNYRRRIERERADSLRYALADLLEALLPALDNFERALSAPPTPDTMEDFHKGIELLHKQLLDTLLRFELAPLATLGKPFDPNYHEAVTRCVSDQFPSDYVLSEHRKGYTYRDRLLRPAMVEVSVEAAAADPLEKGAMPGPSHGESDRAQGAGATPEAAVPGSEPAAEPEDGA